MKPEFYFFGMGNRSKLIYRNGCLYEYPSFRELYRFDVQSELILPAEYTVKLLTSSGPVIIREDEEAVRLQIGEQTRILTEGALRLPDFTGHPHRDLLRVLHHDICINIIGGKPVPNFLVYEKPWYRDSAMMLMVLEQTGNQFLMQDWVTGLTDLYDRNNSGNEESDNLGQLLFLLAKTGNRNHKLIGPALEEANRRLVNGVLTGTTDFAEHPVYQTKWLKLGMDALDIDSSALRIPDIEDGYNQSFWMDGHVEKAYDNPFCRYINYYPYLWWAKEHCMRRKVSPEMLKLTYPLTYEKQASNADYEKLLPLFPEYHDKKVCPTHTWHAVEMFLYLTDMEW